MWTNLAFAVFLIVVSAVLLCTHVRAWRETQRGDSDDKAVDFLRRQFRRRMQASLMIGVVGLTVIAGLWIEEGVISVFYWSGVLLIVVWIAILAIADLVNSRFYLNQIRDQHATERAALQAEVDRIRRRDANGRSEEEQRS
jgi:heme exporter protein D